MTIISTVPLHFQFNMSPSSSSMPGYPYGSSGSYAGAMYAAATSTTKEPASLMGDSINSLRLKAKQHSSSSSPTAIASAASTTSYYPASVSPGKSNASESPNLTLNPDLFSSGSGGGGATSNNNSATTSNSVVVTSESV